LNDSNDYNELIMDISDDEDEADQSTSAAVVSTRGAERSCVNESFVSASDKSLVVPVKSECAVQTLVYFVLFF
jgi:hypothetical protein